MTSDGLCKARQTGSKIWAFTTVRKVSTISNIQNIHSLRSANNNCASSIYSEISTYGRHQMVLVLIRQQRHIQSYWGRIQWNVGQIKSYKEGDCPSSQVTCNSRTAQPFPLIKTQVCLGVVSTNFKESVPRPILSSSCNVCNLCVYMSPPHAIFSRPLIGPQITQSVQVLSLVNPPSLS